MRVPRRRLAGEKAGGGRRGRLRFVRKVRGRLCWRAAVVTVTCRVRAGALPARTSALWSMYYVSTALLFMARVAPLPCVILLLSIKESHLSLVTVGFVPEMLTVLLCLRQHDECCDTNILSTVYN